MPPEAGIGLLFLSNKIPCCLSQALSRHYKRDTLREGHIRGLGPDKIQYLTSQDIPSYRTVLTALDVLQ